MFNQMSPVVKNLVMINVVLFIGTMFLPNLMNFGALQHFSSDSFQPFQLVSHMFLHGSFFHLLFNMFALISLGTLIEQFLGDKKFLLLYMVCGIFAGTVFDLVHYLQLLPVLDAVDLATNDFTINHFSRAFELIKEQGLVTDQGKYMFADLIAKETLTTDEIAGCMVFLEQVKSALHTSTGIMVGASGAVYGVLMCVGLYFPNSNMQIMFIPYPIKAKYIVFALAAISLFFSLRPTDGDNVAHLAHLAGMVPPVFFYFIWKRDKNSFY